LYSFFSSSLLFSSPSSLSYSSSSSSLSCLPNFILSESSSSSLPRQGIGKDGICPDVRQGGVKTGVVGHVGRKTNIVIPLGQSKENARVALTTGRRERKVDAVGKSGGIAEAVRRRECLCYVRK
jgi:hypothetical protein